MALCFKCGSILPDDRESVEKHICEASNIPKKGEEKKPTTTTILKEGL